MIIMNNRTIARLGDYLAPKIAERLAARPRPSDAAGNPEDLLTEAVAAALLDRRPATLAGWRAKKSGPAFLLTRRKRCIRYKLRDVLAYRDRAAGNPEKRS